MTIKAGDQIKLNFTVNSKFSAGMYLTVLNLTRTSKYPICAQNADKQVCYFKEDEVELVKTVHDWLPGDVGAFGTASFKLEEYVTQLKVYTITFMDHVSEKVVVPASVFEKHATFVSRPEPPYVPQAGDMVLIDHMMYGKVMRVSGNVAYVSVNPANDNLALKFQNLKKA